MLRAPSAAANPVPNVANALIMAVQLALMTACFFGAARVNSWWGLVLLAAGFGIVMNSVYSVIHEAEHRMLFSRPGINDAAGVFMALFFPAPFHLLRQGHLGHHMRNRSDDEAFDLYFEGENPLWRYIQMYGILTGCYWLMVVVANPIVLLFPSLLQKKHFEFDRQSAAFMESLNPRYARYIQLEALAVILLHAGILWSFGIPPLSYFVMYFGFGFTWSAMQYVHHYGTERHVTRGARNLFLWGPIDLVWLNHNWHQTHHEHPTVPWPYLPGIGQEENPHRGFLVKAWLRMWRGPRLSREHVENKYAGRIIN
jgi:fatty acid desaturase